MKISEDLKLALMECFNQAASGNIDPQTKENALELEREELSKIDIFDLCVELDMLDEDGILFQIEQQTGQVLTAIPDPIKIQIVEDNQLSAVDSIEEIFVQMKQIEQAQKQVSEIVDNVADRLASLKPS